MAKRGFDSWAGGGTTTRDMGSQLDCHYVTRLPLKYRYLAGHHFKIMQKFPFKERHLLQSPITSFLFRTVSENEVHGHCLLGLCVVVVISTVYVDTVSTTRVGSWTLRKGKVTVFNVHIAAA